MSRYTSAFYELRRKNSLRSARTILPWVQKLVGPRSIVDVGCGSGTWLSVCRELGVEDIRGIDGPWLKLDHLEISQEQFTRHDLTKPFKLDRQFDLVISIEVAEHLPESAADSFVSTLTTLGSLILFSAAIPQQGGLHHVNEQWQSYWIGKFDDLGYQCIDCVRGKFWNNEQVAYWYAQNAFFFARKEQFDQYAALLEAEKEYSLGKMDLVHPRHYSRTVQYPSIVAWARALPLALVRSAAG